MATTIVSNIAVFNDQSGHGNQSHLIYATNQQRWWLFYIDTKTATTVKVKVSSSNDLTSATWGDPGTNTNGTGSNASPAFVNSRAMTANDERNLGVAYANISSTDVVHIDVGIQPTSGNARVQHIRATITAATTISWDTAWNEWSSAATVASPSIIKGNTIGISTTGVVHTGFACASGTTASSGVMGDPNARISTNADTTSTWTNGFGTPAATDDSMSNQCRSSAFAPLASAHMLQVYETATQGADVNSVGLRWNSYTSGAQWPADTGHADVGIGTTSQSEQDWCLCAVNTTNIYAFRRDTTTTIKYRLFNGTTWSSPASTLPTFTGTTIKAGSGLFAATDGTDLYLCVIDSATSNPLSYVKGSTANATISFGSWTSLEAAGSSTTRNSVSGSPVLGNSQLGVIYTTANGASNFDITLSALNFGAGNTFTAKQSSAFLAYV